MSRRAWDWLNRSETKQRAFRWMIRLQGPAQRAVRELHGVKGPGALPRGPRTVQVSIFMGDLNHTVKS